MSETAPERVAALVRDGRKIEAIKTVREETGASLKDALRMVEALERGTSPEGIGDPMEEARALALEGRKIEAIKVLRDGAGLDLKEAKDVVEAMPHPPEAPRTRMLGVAVIACIALIVAILGFVLLV